MNKRLQPTPLQSARLHQFLMTTCAGLAALCPMLIQAAASDEADIDSARSANPAAADFSLDKFYPGSVVPAANCSANKQKPTPATPIAAELDSKPVRALFADVASSYRANASQKWMH